MPRKLTHTAAELAAICDAHVKWLRGESGGVRAALGGACLRGATFRWNDLSRAYFADADLRDCNFATADLSGACLVGADLRGANLRHALLTRSVLADANLCGADLRGADLLGCTIARAKFVGAKLNGANLTGEPWGQYLTAVVPALLTAGGKSLEQVATRATWACHEWGKCPISVAFDCDSIAGVPRLLCPRATQFVALFDAGLIPLPRRKKK